MGKPAPKSAAKPSKTVTVNRSSSSGKFVTGTYARRHPATTETERYRRGK